jgi:putative phosphoribosyl transferase
VFDFLNRAEAGRLLAARLLRLRGEDVVVLGLPRGGIPVAFEVARALDAPLDVIVVRKLGVPFQPELAMGAIGEGGVRVVDEAIVAETGVTDAELVAVEARERAELERRAARFRGGRPPIPFAGKTVVVVDDGIATGSTARAACQVARAQGAARVVLAAPVAPPSSIARLRGEADEVVCVETPEWFFAIGQFYVDFAQLSDDEVVAVLRAAAGVDEASGRAVAAREDPLDSDEEITVPVGPARVAGHLTLPALPMGIVVFAHGSGSNRHSPRNRVIASVLRQAGLATLLVDLLTVAEEIEKAKVFDVELLARRLVGVSRWVQAQPTTRDLRIGYFGASTGAAAALWAAAEPDALVSAVVSRGGRPDLADARLEDVRAPTLLIVGGRDEIVIQLNRRALERLRCESRLAIVPRATHLFEEPGALEEVARLATDWFVSHLTPSAAHAAPVAGSRGR